MSDLHTCKTHTRTTYIYFPIQIASRCMKSTRPKTRRSVCCWPHGLQTYISTITNGADDRMHKCMHDHTHRARVYGPQLLTLACITSKSNCQRSTCTHAPQHCACRRLSTRLYATVIHMPTLSACCLSHLSLQASQIICWKYVQKKE